MYIILALTIMLSATTIAYVYSIPFVHVIELENDNK